MAVLHGGRAMGVLHGGRSNGCVMWWVGQWVCNVVGGAMCTMVDGQCVCDVLGGGNGCVLCSGRGNGCVMHWVGQWVCVMWWEGQWVCYVVGEAVNMSLENGLRKCANMWHKWEDHWSGVLQQVNKRMQVTPLQFSTQCIRQVDHTIANEYRAKFTD